MRNSIFFLLLAVMFLSGCACDPKIVVETKHVAVAPDDNLLVNCYITPPPAEDKYLEKQQPAAYNLDPKLTEQEKLLVGALATAEYREKLMVDWNQALLTDLGKCNARWKNLRLFKEKTKADIEALDNKDKKGK